MLQKDHDDSSSIPTTQVLSSSPAPAPLPRGLLVDTPEVGGGTRFSLVDTPFRMSGNTTFSHDRTGSLRLDLGYSQIDIGETQVDGPEVFAAYEEEEAERAEVLVAKSPEPMAKCDDSREEEEGETQLDDDPDLRTTYFPENSRFDTPRHPNGNNSSSSPAKKTTPTPGPGYNPLARVGFGACGEQVGASGGPGRRLHTGLSLSQMFETTSSPVRPPTGGASLPPTPSKAQLEKVMADSMSRLSSYSTRPRNQPPHVQQRATTTVRESRSSKGQPNPAEVYVSMQESQEAREESARKRHARVSRVTGRKGGGGGGSSSLVFNSSSPVTQGYTQPDPEKGKVDESDDGMISYEDERKRKVAVARKKGVEEVKKVASSAKTSKSSSLERRSKLRREISGETDRRRAEILVREREFGEGSPTDPDDETGDEEEGRIVPPLLRQNSRRKSVSPEQDPRLSMGSRRSSVPPKPTGSLPNTHIAATSSPGASLDLPTPTVLQTQLDPVPDWESIHNVEPLRAARRTKSTTSITSQQPSADMPPFRHQTVLPSTIADSQPAPGLSRQETSMVKTSLKNLPPFNIPSPDTAPAKRGAAAKPGPELVPETSNLEEPSSGLPLPTSSLTPLPSTLSSPAVGIQRSSPPIALKTPYPSRASELRRMKQGATTIPETSPWDRDGMLSPMPPNASQSAPPNSLGFHTSRENMRKSMQESPVRGKRKRSSAERQGRSVDWGSDAIPNSPSEGGKSLGNTAMKSFAALENSSSLLSSRPEPDDLDMVDLVAGLGSDVAQDVAPAQGESATEPPPHKRARASVGGDNEVTPKASESRRKKTASSAKGKPQPTKSAKSATADTTKRGKAPRKSTGRVSNSKPRTTARKTRSSTSLRGSVVGAAADSPIPMAAPELEDELESNNPVFSVASCVAPIVDSSLVSPERVFALFKDVKMCYHPATVLSTDSKGFIKVVFDDGTEDVLDKEVRSLDLRIGDMVKVDQPSMKKAVWIIVGLKKPVGEPDTHERVGGRSLTDIRGHAIVTVKPRITPASNSMAEDEVLEVPLTRIYLNRTLWAQFSKRPYNDIPHRSQILPLRISTPSTTDPTTDGVNQASTTTPNTPSRNRRTTPITTTTSAKPTGGLFFNMLFALSFGENESEKRTVSHRITSNGGRLVDNDFEDLFHQETPATAGLTPRTESAYVGFTCVIANKHSRRVKFLQALALGIPCLAPRWVEDCVRARRLLDWDTYLLPAGESAYLAGAVRSRVMEYVSAREARFLGMVGARRRLLPGGLVVVVMGKGGAGLGRWKPYLFLAYAMGAGKVLTVQTVEAALDALSRKQDGGLDKEEAEKLEEKEEGGGGGCRLVYVDARERKHAERLLHRSGRNVRVVDDEWVIQSLILGKLIAGEQIIFN
ncbi:unnamed protein product [Tuber melanosporum]|uniref:(Perigord truffle) hypothetical protein n=1 Tax=Tuber melanosporum (strain Mel28) TaxID=656061 RepID=D5GCP8_TUBMM|nr:uncharacterized protein GSTUM_00005953001 [Tuber melanosporum]CAZ82291.1 unnamed protein product [Tuber melanosporum]